MEIKILEMKLQEAAPTKIVLETDPPNRKWSEYLRMLIIPPLLLAGAIFLLNLPSWLIRAVIGLAILIEIVTIVVVSSELVVVSETGDALVSSGVGDHGYN